MAAQLIVLGTLAGVFMGAIGGGKVQLEGLHSGPKAGALQEQLFPVEGKVAAVEEDAILSPQAVDIDKGGT